MTQKRKSENQDSASPQKKQRLTLKYDTLLFDIEGTTTSISFVAEVLFPYARENVRSHLETTYESPITQSILKRVAILEGWIDPVQSKTETCTTETETALNDSATVAKIECEDSIECNENEDAIKNKQKNEKIQNESPTTTSNDLVEQFLKENKETCIIKMVHFVENLMNKDLKQAELKELQGHIWKKGYEDGKLKGHVYEDVLPLWKEWIEQGGKIRIYSSGSVAAQKLLFQYSEKGDLLHMLSGHYDIMFPGSKVEAKSYSDIAQDMNLKPESILFVTDNIKEAEASQLSGMPCILSIRPGTAVLPDNHPFPTIHSFEELKPHIFC